MKLLQLALEIPTSQLERLAPLCDLDFILAHKVLQDEKYASFFARRGPRRELILDNSTHEFGSPMEMKDLLKAAKIVNADVLIAPDIVNETMDYVQYKKNMEWLRTTIHAAPEHLKIGAVMCGLDEQQRRDYVSWATLAEVMCFSFHCKDRLIWFEEFVKHPLFRTWRRVHVLGVFDAEDVRKWYRVSERPELQHITFSIDTTKAVKWGKQNLFLTQLNNWRGGPIDAKAVLELDDFTEEQLQTVEYNIMYLRDLCRGKA